MKKMKKLVLFLTFAIVFSGLGLFAPIQAEAQSPMQGCVIVRDIQIGEAGEEGSISVNQGDRIGPGEDYEDTDDPIEGWAFLCMVNIVNRAAQLLFYSMMAVVILLVIYGGFLILTARANEDKVTKGKQFITYAIIGVAVAIFAWAVPALVGYMI